MTPANPEPPQRARPVLRQVAWASVPVWSIGFLSFVPFLAYAVMNRRKRDWAVFAAYLAATIAMIIALGTVGSGSNAGGAVGGFIIALAGCAAVHTAVLFRPGRARGALGPAGAGAPGTLGPAEAGALERPGQAPWGRGAWRSATGRRSPRRRAGSNAGRTRAVSPRRTRPWPANSRSAGPTCPATTTTAASSTSITCQARRWARSWDWRRRK